MIKNCNKSILLFNSIFSIIFINFFVVSVFLPQNPLGQMSIFKVCVAFILYMGFLLISFYYARTTRVIPNFLSYFFLVFIAIGIVILQIGFVRSYATNVGWDSAVIMDSAWGLNVPNWDFQSVNYFATYPNNTTLLLLYKYFFKILIMSGISNYWFYAVVINVILIDVSIILIYLTCNKLWGKRVAICSFVISVPVIGFNLWMAVPYSDIVSLPIGIFIFYLSLCINEKNKFALAFIMGIATAFGFLVKPTNIIVVIALFILFFIKKGIKKNGIPSYIKSFLCFIVGASLVFGSFNFGKHRALDRYDYTVREEMLSFPFTHFIMMGMNGYEKDGKIYYNAYCEKDVMATLSHYYTKDKMIYNVSEIKHRLSTWGGAGYLKFVIHKADYIFGDGTLFYGGEGNFYTGELPIVNNKMQGLIQSIAYAQNENYQNFYMNLLQGIWVALLFFLVIGTVFDIYRRKENLIDVARLTMFGYLMFHLIFEGRSRYLINLLPIMILCSIYGIIQLIEWVKERKS